MTGTVSAPRVLARPVVSSPSRSAAGGPALRRGRHGTRCIMLYVTGLLELGIEGAVPPLHRGERATLTKVVGDSSGTGDAFAATLHIDSVD